MPFYEYQCSSCGHHCEELQKVGDRPLRKCQVCGRSTLRRLVSAPVFRLKGGGWYETDFKADKEAQRNLAGEKEPAPAADAAAAKPTEEKKEGKADKPDKPDKPDQAAPAAKTGAAAPARPAAAGPKPARRPVRRRRRR